MNTEQTLQTTKFTMWLNHVKNNRIEYLILGLICHALGITDKLLTQTQGVCF
jgi:hypothetical protein